MSSIAGSRPVGYPSSYKFIYTKIFTVSKRFRTFVQASGNKTLTNMKKVVSIFILIQAISLPVYSKWIAQNSGTNQNLYDIEFLNDKTGWAVGDAGVVIKTTDGGIYPLSLVFLLSYLFCETSSARL